MSDINQRISEAGVVPVIKLNHPERDAAPLARALCAGGIPVAEVTFRAAGADLAIRIMKETCPEMTVGAGTVLTVEQIDRAQAAGAEFIVTPGFFSGKQNARLLWNEDGTPTARTQKILAATPMGRFGLSEELEGTLLFLVNERAASFITGVVIPVDGGFSAYSGV